MNGNTWHIIIQPIKKILESLVALGFSTLPSDYWVINFRITSALAAASLRVRVGSFTSCKEFSLRLFVTSNGTISCEERFNVTVFWSLFWYTKILTPLVTLSFPTINASIFPFLQLNLGLLSSFNSTISPIRNISSTELFLHLFKYVWRSCNADKYSFLNLFSK